MGYLFELTGNRSIDGWMAMSVDITPDTAYTIDELIAVDIGKHASLGGLDHERLIILHLGESVPDIVSVPLSKDVPVGWGRVFRVIGGHSEKPH